MTLGHSDTARWFLHLFPPPISTPPFHSPSSAILSSNTHAAFSYLYSCRYAHLANQRPRPQAAARLLGNGQVTPQSLLGRVVHWRRRLGRRRQEGLQPPEGRAAGRGRGVSREPARPSAQRKMASPLAALFPLLLLPLLLGPAPAAGHGGKYSREKNEPTPRTEEFRMEKLNQLWEKAQRLHLSPVKLSELHADLKLQDRDELSWKKMKVEGLDEDGEKEARLIRNLNVILAKYGLDGRKDAQVTNYIRDGDEDQGLDDPRLEKLWHKAKTSGKFSTDELDKLWRELKHHKEKVHEYNVLLETLSRTEDIHENVISPEDMSRLQEEVLQSRHAELKGRLRAINQGFERLQRVSLQGYGAHSEFEEPRVMDLWDMAKSSNFTKKELESFREELKHFEAKVEKHQHYQKQLELSHQKLRHVESAGDPEHMSRSREKYAMLEEKAKELGYKVKKHLQDLTSRVSRGQHNEL
ncbi:PREDICTED: alpha-2-macroglobulin receptor-associated protein [Elephantulus edwardii]|uniref:alpha-2-macroglobulin receptor-associated protein n=1 Tax=Elephantulus edwardii TaxID=28737 RepID=UPI0003F0BC91|nr:PREDICTED: alpha-2-macroglobulin receptor-associated protein [Elephantulus edwardii]